MKSELTLKTEFKYGKTNLQDLFCTPPYRIMSPFMDGDVMEVCLMSSSAGLLAGDEFALTIDVGDDCNLRFVSQSYEKILNTKDDMANRILDVKVGENATLKYLPYPAIPFSGSSYSSINKIHLSENSSFVYSDIFSCGRVGMGEKYGLESFKSNTRIFVGEKIAFADNTVIVPKRINYEKIGLWGNCTHNGMLYMYSPQMEKLEEIVEKSRELSEECGIYAGSTFCAKGIVIRSLGYSGDELYSFNKQLSSFLDGNPIQMQE